MPLAIHSPSPDVSLQWAAQNFVSDAAMEAALQGRAEYARILADLGFLPVGYAGACNNNAQNPSEEEYAHYDEYSSNARVIKAAICAGENSLPCGCLCAAHAGGCLLV